MKFLFDIIKGIFIGIANAIPGVSGGTMMVSMGIYDDIISCITNLFRQFKKSIITLLPYVIGMGIGIVGLAFGIEYLFGSFPMQTAFLFIGLILGGLPILWGHLKGKKLGVSNGIVFLLFFALIIIMQLMGGKGGREVVLEVSFLAVGKLFLIGVLASATMVIPGVSGSMILMILGYYNPIIETVTSFVKALAAFDVPGLMHGLGIILPFGIGVVIGIFLIAKLIEILLKKQEGLTYSAILGLVAASPAAIIMQNTIPAVHLMLVVSCAVTFAVGFGIAFLLGRE